MNVDAFIYSLGLILVCISSLILVLFSLGYLTVLGIEYYNRRVFRNLVAIYTLEKIRAFHANRRYLKVVWDSKKYEADMLKNLDLEED